MVYTKISALAKKYASQFEPPVHISRNFRHLDNDEIRKVVESLKTHYFVQAYVEARQFSTQELYLGSKAGKNDLENQVTKRLKRFREEMVPWLDHAKRLSESTILEIGCGTGSSTAALAEQGANVTAIDIDSESIAVAKERCEIHGLEVEFLEANATEVHELFSDRHFDTVIFFATLEHMTHGERITAMSQTWNMLSKGSLWCVIDTPNRLWYYDRHTSQLPFFMWLPDNLALAYARFSPRSIVDMTCTNPDEKMLNFLRRGRGVSYHEFDLTLNESKNLDVVSSLPIFLREQNRLGKLLYRLTNEYRYESMLASRGPDIHEGFYQPYLDLIIRKN